MRSAPAAVPAAPPMPTGEVVVQPPPSPDRAESGGVLMTALPMLGSVGAIALLATTGGHAGARTYLAAGLLLFATISFAVVQVDRQRRMRRRRSDAQRDDYLSYLAGVRSRVRASADAQRAALAWHHPPPEALAVLAAEGTRLGERGPTHPHFLRVRYGLQPQPLAVGLTLAEETAGSARADPVMADAVRRLVTVQREQPALPVALDLRAHRLLRVGGSDDETRAAARALLCSATAFHAPAHLVVAVLTTPARRVHWDWVKWLPHAVSPCARDAVGPRRLVTTGTAELAALLPPPQAGAARPHLLLVVDGAAAPVLRPDEPVTVVELGLGAAGAHDLDASAGGTDRIPPPVAEAYARRVATRHARPVPERSGPDGLLALLGVTDVVALDPATTWGPRAARDRLRVPIGVDDAGEPVHLDLKESSQHGMGPHGLVIGATGSGKSELLRTLVLGLALTHPPDQLNLVLVDFKGGATFAGAAALPHVSAVITNLADDLALVARMEDALAGELVRRQELLRAAGNLSSVVEYEHARHRNPAMAPLPALLVVVDEFSELLSARPELTDLFVAIGRLGRSLGLHLLLSSQRLEEGRLRGLDSHLSYRIGLRTFSPHESRAVLGVPDAYELPTTPGAGYLKSGPGPATRFQAAHVSAPPASRAAEPPTARPGAPGILPFSVAAVQCHEALTVIREAPEPRPGTAPSLLELVVARLSGHGPAAHRIWQPPLDVPDTLGALLSQHARGPATELVVPVGVVDRPREQRRDPLAVDLRGAAGHVAVVGGPRSGRSTLLRTLIASLALTASPRAVQLFLIDLGGGALGPLAGLPHVAGIGGRGEPDVLRRIVAEAGAITDRREAWLRRHGIDSVDTYRARRRTGEEGDGFGDVFVVVDGWTSLRTEFEDLADELQRLAQRGLTYGIHLVTSATRWADYRPALRDLLGTRLELRLGDPVDSELDRRSAALVPPGRPGRGLTPDGLHFLAALPRADGDARAATLDAGLAHLVEHVRRVWPGPPAPPLRLLPTRIGLAEVRAAAGAGVTGAGVTGADGMAAGDAATAGRPLLLGVAERDLAPVALDPDSAPHLLVLGDGGSGRSSLLRAYAREVIRTRSPQQAQLVVVDYRRALLGEISEDHLLAHHAGPADAEAGLQELAAYLHRRLPGPGVTVKQLRERSWWRGAEVFVLIDDYDLVATGTGSPVRALLPLLAQAGDIGLHVVLVRRSGGASRALHEPVIQTLCDLATPALLLSGDPAEGPLLGGVRPVPAPPGRARLVTRERGVDVVQLAFAPPRRN